MEKSDKIKIAVIIFTLFAMMCLLVGLLERTLGEGGSDIGIRNNTPEQMPDMVTQEQLDKEYESRNEIPVRLAETLPSIVLSRLSSGSFDQLDSQLKDWQDSYKDNDDQSSDEGTVIDMYRGDLAYYKTLMSCEALDNWYFYNPDVLAAAAAYAPVSAKYKAFINPESVVLPASRDDVAIKEVDLGVEEAKELMALINGQRSENSKFMSLKVFNMSLFTYTARFIAVQNYDAYYQPYSLTLLEYPDCSMTCRLARSIMESGQNSNLDAIFVAPSQTDMEPIPPKGGEIGVSVDSSPIRDSSEDLVELKSASDREEEKSMGDYGESAR